MTLFGDLGNAYDKAQQLPMLPTLLVMKGASKAGDLLKKHTFLGKAVKDTNTGENKRIWRGSRGLRKNILEPSIKTTDEKSGGTLKGLRNSYTSYQNWGKKLAERHAALSSKNPSPKQVSALAERFRNNTASDADKEKIKNLNLRYDTNTKTLVPRKPLEQKDILERLGQTEASEGGEQLMTDIQNNALSPEDHKMLQAFGLKAYPDGSVESIKELPLNPLEKRLCVYYNQDLSKASKLQMEDINDENLKLNLRMMRANQFNSLAPTMMDVLAELNLKVENGVLVDNTPKTVESSESPEAVTVSNAEINLEKDELSPSEIELYKILANEPKADITHIHEMKNEGIKEQFGYIRNGQLDKLDKALKTRLGMLGLSIDEENGRIREPKDPNKSLDKRFPEPLKEDSIKT